MADSQGQNYYWQSDNQNTTGENVGAVLDDLCDIIIITEIQNNQNTVTFVPGLNGERGHFRLGVGSKPINADKYTILTATGSPDNYAEGNEVEVLLKEGETYGNESCALFISDEVNGFRLKGSDGEGGGTDFIIANNAVVEIGNKPVEPWEEGVMEMGNFNDTEIFNTSFMLENAAQFKMTKKDGTQTPYFQMLGDSFIDIQYNNPSNYFDYSYCGHESIRTGIRSINPFYYEKDNPSGSYPPTTKYTTEAPIFQFHDAATFQMFDKSMLQMKNGATAVLQGNANIHISGGEWTNGYHVLLHDIFTVSITHAKNGTTTYGSIKITFENVQTLSSNLREYLFRVECEQNYYIRNLLDILDPVGGTGIQGITVEYITLTRDQVIESSYTTITSTYWANGDYTDTTIHDLGKITKVEIGPNSFIDIGNDESGDKLAAIQIRPTQVRIGIGARNDIKNPNFIYAPNYYGAYSHVGGMTYDTNSDFPITKAVERRSAGASSVVSDMISNVADPYFEILSGSALKVGANAMTIRDTDGYSSCLIDDMMIQGSSAYTQSVGAGGASNVKVYREYNNAEVADQNFTTGKFSKRFTFTGTNVITFGPKTINKPDTLLGINLSGDYTDIEGHWDNFQAIMSGHDSFIQWDGNNHFESWSGTQIFRASNPNLQKHTWDTYYPYFPQPTDSAVRGTISETKTIEVPIDLSSYTNQQIADAFGASLTATAPSNVWNKRYETPVLNVNGITKTFIGNTYVQSVDLKTSTASSKPYIYAAKVYAYSDTNYTTASAALADATIKEIVGEAINIGGTWDYAYLNSYSKSWDSTVNKYKLYFSMNIDYKAGVKLLYHSTAASTPNDFYLPANTTYYQMSAANKAVVDKALKVLDNKVYRNGELVAWCTGGTIYNKNAIITNSPTNYTVTQTGTQYSVTATTTIGWYKTQHLGQNWFGPIQTADRIGSNNASDWEKGPIMQAYGPVNFTMREKWTADYSHTKTYTLTSSETYDVSNQAQAIADFEANATDYAAFEAYLTQEGYTLWDIISIATATGGYTITFSICEAGWKPHIDSYPDNPVVEITDGSELRLYGGVKVKGETKYGVTTFTFSGTQAEGEVSFTLDELRMLKTLVGSVRTAVVNDPSEAVELGTLYFIDEGGNA